MSDPKSTIDDVKNWFSPLPVLDNKSVTNHLTSLTKYGDNLVKSPNDTSLTAWTKIFGECLSDVKAIPDVEFVKNYRTKFQANSRLPDDKLNQMTKKEFVSLFAETMNDIFNKEKEPPSTPPSTPSSTPPSTPSIFINYDSNGCILNEEVYNEPTKKCYKKGEEPIDGGSKNKSRKRSTRKPRRSRRHRRRTTTRKYKKLYK